MQRANKKSYGGKPTPSAGKRVTGCKRGKNHLSETTTAFVLSLLIGQENNIIALTLEDLKRQRDVFFNQSEAIPKLIVSWQASFPALHTGYKVSALILIGSFRVCVTLKTSRGYFHMMQLLQAKVQHYTKKLFDLSILVREYDLFFCFPARVDKIAQMKAEPVPATNTKKAQLNLQWPSL